MIDLTELLKFKNITIQCHDNPDPDAIACAFALHEYFCENCCTAEIVYSGFSQVRKSNLCLMIEELGINLKYIPKDSQPEDIDRLLDTDALLVVVDGQYGAGNVKKLSAKNIAVIDHHVIETPEVEYSDIRYFLSSCSTLVWQLLKKAGFDFSKHDKVSTALYYGLFTDTGGLTEICHPLDRDARDNLAYDKSLLKKLKNCNLAISDLMIAGRAIVGSSINPKYNSAIFFVEPCDPNILGFTADLALQVDSISTCIVFCEVGGGVKLSVRSCVREIMAGELAGRLCEGIGSGGGHDDKAGGFISLEHIKKNGKNVLDFLTERYESYFSQYDLIYCGQYRAQLDEFEMYSKVNIPVGFVKTTDICASGGLNGDSSGWLPEGTELIVRTIEGDTQITVSNDTYIMVGICQEIYPIKRERFEKTYITLKGKYTPHTELLGEKHYTPAVKISKEGITKNITEFIRPCVASGGQKIYAKQLTKRTKVFTKWSPQSYFYGAIGDWLAVRADDPSDAYIIGKTIFSITYQKT